MPLLTLKRAAEELGLKSEQSVRNLADRGEFKILKVKITGARGSPRVDSADLEAYQRRLRNTADADPGEKGAEPPAGGAARTAVRRPATATTRARPARPGPQRSVARGRAPLMHFE